MNIDGANTLACTTPIRDCKDTIHVYPLPNLPVVKDLIVDLTHFLCTVRLHSTVVTNADTCTTRTGNGCKARRSKRR